MASCSTWACRREPACVSRAGYSGVFVPDRGLPQPGRGTWPKPLQLRPLPPSLLEAAQGRRRHQNRTERLQGDVLVVSCWRQHRGRTNPSHFLHGYGQIIGAALSPAVPRNLSTLIFSQCADIDRWPLASAIWALIRRIALRERLISRATRTLTLSLAGPAAGRRAPSEYEWSRQPTRRDGLLCGAMHVSTRVAEWLPCGPRALAAWRKQVSAWLARHAVATAAAPPPATRAVVWVRSKGQQAGRRLVNLDEVRQLFAPPADVVTASENMTALEHARLFRSFRVLVTPHGSHVAGLVFAAANTTVVEVQIARSDVTFVQNARCLVEGGGAGGRYVLSTGHAPASPVPSWACAEGAPPTRRCLMHLKDSDVRVNLTLLRGALGLG